MCVLSVAHSFCVLAHLQCPHLIRSHGEIHFIFVNLDDWVGAVEHLNEPVLRAIH